MAKKKSLIHMKEYDKTDNDYKGFYIVAGAILIMFVLTCLFIKSNVT